MGLEHWERPFKVEWTLGRILGLGESTVGLFRAGLWVRMPTSSLHPTPEVKGGFCCPHSPVDWLTKRLATGLSPQEIRHLALGAHPIMVCWVNKSKEDSFYNEKGVRMRSWFLFPALLSGAERLFFLSRACVFFAPYLTQHKDALSSSLAAPHSFPQNSLPSSILLCLCTLFVWQVPWELAKPWGHFPVTDTL